MHLKWWRSNLFLQPLALMGREWVWGRQMCACVFCAFPLQRGVLDGDALETARRCATAGEEWAAAGSAGRGRRAGAGQTYCGWRPSGQPMVADGAGTDQRGLQPREVWALGGGTPGRRQGVTAKARGP